MVAGSINPLALFYRAIGAGWYYTTFDYNQDKFSFLKDENLQGFCWHISEGAEMSVGSNLTLTAENR